MIFPDQVTFYRDKKKFTYVPIAISWMADLETPISIFLKINANCLLESVEKGDSMGRYSIIACEKKTSLSFHNKSILIKQYSNGEVSQENTISLNDPLNYLKEWRENNTCAFYEDLPPFFGGLLGYLGHEIINYFEPKVPIHKYLGEKDSLKIPDGILYFHEIILVYDNVKRQATLIKLCGPFDQSSNQEENEYSSHLQHLKKIKKQITHPQTNKPTNQSDKPFQNKSSKTSSSISSNCTQKEYEAIVKKAKSYIENGEIIQVVPSHRFSVSTNLDPFEIYRTLKTQNPSPYLYYFNFEDFQMIGSSPEVMVKVEMDELLLKPIAGTRPRGKNFIEDAKLAQDLLHDEKEISEHLMLVDLARNDLGRVAEVGSVEVVDYMSIEKYSQVQHISSTIKAKKKKEFDAIDVLKATFPAGTLSGAPKIRALQIIHELEKDKRSAYGGMVLYYSLNGNLNSCITIRTIILKDKVAHIQAGAGIVIESVPSNEYQETVTKAKALIKAIQKTEERIYHGFND